MSNEKIIDRVKKLLRLATSDNINEAATSAAVAQELINKYNLSHLLLSEDPFAENVIKDYGKQSPQESLYEFGKNSLSWKSILANGIAQLNHCRVYIGRRQTNKFIGIIGAEDDVSIVRYLFLYLVTEIEALCIKEGDHNKTWRNNFKLAAVSQILKILRETAERSKRDFKEHCQDEKVASEALARFSDKLARVDEYIENNMKLGKGKSVASAYNHEAAEAGKRAASKINLNKSLTGTQHKQLKS